MIAHAITGVVSGLVSVSAAVVSFVFFFVLLVEPALTLYSNASQTLQTAAPNPSASAARACAGLIHVKWTLNRFYVNCP